MHETHPLCPIRIAPTCLALGLVLAAPFPPPSHAQEFISVARISEDSNIRTDRRPIHVGLHAADANKNCLVIDQYHPDAKLLITEDGDGSVNTAKRDVFIGRVIDGGS